MPQKMKLTSLKFKEWNLIDFSPQKMKLIFMKGWTDVVLKNLWENPFVVSVTEGTTMV